MINRAAFFDAIREPLFRGMTKDQVAGCEAILDEAEKRGLDPRFTAYMLATAWWETDETMQAVRERGLGRGHAYGLADPQTHQAYYGRGLVQLTWKANYAKMGKVCAVDLVGHPDLALQLPIAVEIMFAGMLGGLFTGRKLTDYFHGSVTDWTNARRIINGVDKASTIAGAAIKFNAALKAGAPVKAVPVS